MKFQQETMVPHSIKGPGNIWENSHTVTTHQHGLTDRHQTPSEKGHQMYCVQHGNHFEWGNKKPAAQGKPEASCSQSCQESC